MKSNKYLKDWFNYLNHIYFGGYLPNIPINFNVKVCEKAADGLFIYETKNPRIEIGMWFSSEKQLVKAIKHEMIHLHLFRKYWKSKPQKKYPKWLDKKMRHTKEFKYLSAYYKGPFLPALN